MDDLTNEPWCKGVQRAGAYRPARAALHLHRYRQPNPQDKRGPLTSLSRVHLAQAKAAVLQGERDAAAGRSPEEKAPLMAPLKRVVGHLDRAANQADPAARSQRISSLLLAAVLNSGTMPPASPTSIAVIDPDRSQAATLEAAVRPLGPLSWYTTTAEALTKCSGPEQIFIAGLTRPARETFHCLHEMQTRFPGSASILVAEYGDYMALDSATRTRDNFLLAFRPFEIPKLMVQLDRAVNAVKLAAQLAKMRDVLGREKAR